MSAIQVPDPHAQPLRPPEAVAEPPLVPRPDPLESVRAIPLGARVLLLLGYLTLGLVVVTALVLDVVGRRLPATSYTPGVTDLAAPDLLGYLGLVVFVVGWALLLTGGPGFGWRLFVPLMLFMPIDLFQPFGRLPRIDSVVLVPLFLCLPLAAMLLQVRARHDREPGRFPLVRFLGWLAGLGGYLLLVDKYGLNLPLLEMSLIRLTVVGIVLMPTWSLLGMNVAWVGVDLGASMTQRLLRRLGDRGFLRVAALSPLVPAVLMCAVLLIFPGARARPDNPWELTLVSLAFGPPFVLLPWTVGRLLLRRWHRSSAAATLSLSVVLVLVVLALTVAGLTQRSFGGAALVGPALVGVLGLAGLLWVYRTLLWVTPLAGAAPTWDRQIGVLGAVIRFGGGTLLAMIPWRVNPARGDQELWDFLAVGFLAGVVLLAPLSLLWTAWRKPARLVEAPAVSWALTWTWTLFKATLPEARAASRVLARQAASHAAILGRAAPRWLAVQSRGILAACLVDMNGLPRQTRLLIWFGYACLAGIVGLALWPELVGDLEPRIAFTMLGFPMTAPAIHLPIAVGMFVVGWALVLTGATDLGWRSFMPLLAMFALDLYFQAWYISNQTAPLAWGAASVLVVAAILVQVVTRRRPHWRDRPLLEFFGWVVALSLYVGLTWWLTWIVRLEWLTERVVLTRLLWLGLILCPFWVYLGMEPARLGLELGERGAHWLRHRLDEHHLRQAATLSTIAFLILLMPYYLFATMTAIVLWPRLGASGSAGFSARLAAAFLAPAALWPVVVAVVGLRRLVARRASTEAALRWLHLSGAAFVLVAAVGLAVSARQDFISYALSLPALLNPFVLYVALMCQTLFTFGSSYANAEGETAPRTGRALVYLGLVMMAMCAALLPNADRALMTGNPNAMGDFIDQLFAFGVTFLGSFFILWSAWKLYRRPLEPDEDATPAPEPEPLPT